MRHLNKGRILNRKPQHRKALLRNLACSLFAHERIVTTVAKAKELRPFAERLITLARRGSIAQDQASKETGETARTARAAALHSRRRLIALLGSKKRIVVGKQSINIVDKLLRDIAPRYLGRPGGYTRILKRTQVRLGDAAPTAIIELVESAVAPS